ncbi:MAG: hypothetical protein ABSE86_04600 [Bryobacteraceae bacterium]|jgi:hypothetical protein
MDPTLRAVLAVSMRWIHITSVVTLIGGFIFARFALAPALATLNEPRLGKKVVENFRPLLYTVLVTVIGSGLYNYLNKPSYPPHYHMWIGIKFLFALHIFAVAVLYSIKDADEGKRNRWLSGMIASGLIIIAISAYLRFISLK